MPGSVRVFIACSLDGFIAGPNDDLSWLPKTQGDDHGFRAFLEGISALLMGRATYDEGLVDQLIVTIVPVVLGDGAPLFAGVRKRRKLELGVRESSGGLVQLEYRPV